MTPSLALAATITDALLTETAVAVVDLADAGFPWVTCAQYDAAEEYCAAHGDPFLLDRAEDDPETQRALYRSLVTSAQAFLPAGTR